MNLKSKILAFSAVVVSSALVIAFAIDLYKIRSNVIEQAGERLYAISNTAVLQLDADLHEAIEGNGAQVESGKEAFETLRDQLRAVEAATQLQSPLYTLRKAPDFEQSQEFEFVVMTPSEPFIGNRIKAQPHLLKAYEGKAAVSDVYEDEHGAWISSASPVFDARGKVIAILQADKKLSYLKELWLLELPNLGIKIAATLVGVGFLVLLTIGKLQNSILKQFAAVGEKLQNSSAE